MCSLSSTPAGTLPSVAAASSPAPRFDLVWTRTEAGNVALTIYASPEAVLAMLDAIAEGAPVIRQQPEPPPYDTADFDALRVVVKAASGLVDAMCHPLTDAEVNRYRCAHGQLLSEPCMECENELPF